MAPGIPLRILFVEDLPSDAELAEREIQKGGIEFTARRVDTKDAFLLALREFQPDVIVSDYMMPEFDGMQALKLSLERDSMIPFIVLTGSMNEETAVECMKAGASDYVIKEHVARLPYAIREAFLQFKMRAEKKRVEQALKDSEEQFRAVAESAVDSIITIDQTGSIVGWNQGATHTFGYAKEEIMGHTLGALIPEKYREALDNALRSIRNIADPQISATTVALEGRRKAGSTFPLELSLAQWETKDGRFFTGILRDVTDRMRIEQALRTSEERLKLALTATKTGVWEWDARTDEVFWSQECFDIIGIGPSDKTFQSFQRNVHPEDLDRLHAAVQQAITHKTQFAIEFRVINPRGEVLWLYDLATVEYDNIGNPLRMVGTVRDITELKRVADELSASEQRFRQLFDDAPVGYHEIDTQGRIVELNRTEQVMLGYDAEDMLGHRVWEFVMEGEASREGILAKLAGSRPSNHTYERTFRRRDGTALNVLVNDRALRNDAGKIVGIRSTVQDITELKIAERELRLMAQTVASARDCISITDLQNKLLFANDAFRKVYGYTKEELTGKDIAIVRPPDSREATAENIFEETLAGGWHGELMNRRKNGTDFPVELWTSIVKDEAGSPVAMVGVARDISNRKTAEDHLRKSEEQFRLIAENVDDMIAVVDLNGRRIYNSPSYKSLFGDPESSKGTDGFREINPDDVGRVKQVFEETVRTGVGQRSEYQFLLNDGSVRNIESKGSVIRDGDGKISQVIVVSRDVTEDKRIAAQFLRSQRMESIGTLASGIAHDLNNVLAPIMMAIEILRTKISDSGGQKILNTIETSAKRGADIVRQVLAFGRGVKSDRVLVQLEHIVNEVVKIAGETFPKSIEITTDIPRNLWTVFADPTQMHQVLLNMLVNARDAMPKGGTLTISAENITLDEYHSRMQSEAKPGDYVSMAITDTGTGIPAGIQEKIFEPFFTTKEIGMGTGLGLSTTLAIVKSHEGFINLQSELGKGTAFRIFIPATGTASGAEAASEVVDLPMGHGELVLIIDDEAAIREITKETLEAYGYRALTASDGAEGVAAFAENKKMIRAVIIDIMMPVMDGTAAILVLQQIDPEVKIIAASGLTTKGKVTTPPNSNVQGVLTKPYTAEKLLKALKTVLQ